MTQLKHNKKRNSGLLYEFLVRQVSKAMVEKDRDGYQAALQITRKYFGDGQPLAAERELFDVIRNTRGVTESASRRILVEVQDHAMAMDAKKIDIKKSNLIKEVNRAFGPEFFVRHRVPEYKLLASIHMIIEAVRQPGMLSESVQGIRVEEGVVQYMTTTGDYSIVQPRRQEIDGLVMAMVAKRFSERYGDALTSDQKLLLGEYTRAQVTGDQTDLRKHIERDRSRIASVFESAKTTKEFVEDKVMQERLVEARKRLDSISVDGDADAAVEELLLHQRLAAEIQSDE